MIHLNIWKFAAAAAITFAALNAVCAIAVAVSPDPTIAFFNTWFHGLDLRLVVPPGGRPVTWTGFIAGVLSAAAAAFAGGAILAGCYEMLGGKAPTRR